MIMYYQDVRKILSITKAREDLPSLVNQAKNDLDEYVITVNGSPAAILLSFDEYESWRETMEILSDPEELKDIRQGEKDIAEGNYVTLEELKKELNV